jgi:hypothetical protein
VGSATKYAEPFTKQEENMLWEKGVISLDNPQGLFNMQFFLLQWQRLLFKGMKTSQFKNGYIYTEHASKNQSGGLYSFNTLNKTVVITAVANPRCHSNTLDQYIKRLPPQAIHNDVFYVRPLTKVENHAVRFTHVPVGRNKLAKVTLDM